MVNEEKMLRMVLDDANLRSKYNYREEDYENIFIAMESDNIVVSAVARIIHQLKDKQNKNDEYEESVMKTVYNSVSNYIMDNCIL